MDTLLGCRSHRNIGSVKNTAFNLGPVQGKRSVCHLVSNKDVYKMTGIERTDKFLVEVGYKFINGIKYVKNGLNQSVMYRKSKLVNYLYENMLFDSINRIVYYNQRYTNFRIDIYSLEQ